jgi:hypothetical protein
MTRPHWTRRFLLPLCGALLAPLLMVVSIRSVRAGQDTQQTPPQQGQENQNQGQSQQQQKPKKKGGFFGGLKAVTGSSSEQTADTASAGTKGVGEGQQIADVTPTAADRQAVFTMETYSVPRADLSKFIEDGHLKH